MEKNNKALANPMVKNKYLVGAREWCLLPELNLGKIRAKVDTGAKTSSLHAKPYNVFVKGEEKWIEFMVLPHENLLNPQKRCQAKLVDHRYVVSSSGHREKRYVIETRMVLGKEQFSTQVTLTNRGLMNYPMLIGRASLKRFLVDPSKSYLQKLLLQE